MAPCHGLSACSVPQAEVRKEKRRTKNFSFLCTEKPPFTQRRRNKKVHISVHFFYRFRARRASRSGGIAMAFSVREENAEGAGPASLSGSPVLPAEGIPSVSPAEMNLFRLFPLFCGLPLAIPFSLMYILPQFAGTESLLFRSWPAAASRNGFSCFQRSQYVFFQPFQGTSLLRLLFPRSGTHVLAFHIPPARHQGAGRPQRSGNRDAYPLAWRRSRPCS